MTIAELEKRLEVLKAERDSLLIRRRALRRDQDTVESDIIFCRTQTIEATDLLYRAQLQLKGSSS